jgi:ferredoxin
MDVFVPACVGTSRYDFVPYGPEVEVAWEYDLAYNTLKRFVLPPKEDLIRFRLDDLNAEPVIESRPQLLFGVHPYDIKAMNQLDQLMETGSMDVNYRARRDATRVFGLHPQTIAPTSFWASMDAAGVDFGFDLYWTKISPAAFLVEVGSAQGEEMLTQGKKHHFQLSTPAEREAARREKNRIAALSARRGLNFPWQETPKVLSRSWDSPLWEERARTCLSCGSCVLVCPTCYCFDVQEEVDDLLQTGRRYRAWDGCMLAGFASIAGGHNFRSSAWQRYRHRYFRKGKYIFDKIGELGCIGCGRCVQACTADIANPMAIFNTLWEEQQ